MPGIVSLCLAAYGASALRDLAEHFRLEKAATGRLWSWTVVGPAESALHVAIGLVVIAAALLARPLPDAPALRDGFVLAAPFLFVGLGLADEIGFHRRRCDHREDMMHTVSHLLALAAFAALWVGRVLA